MNSYNEIIENKKLSEKKLNDSIKSFLFWGITACICLYFDWNTLFLIAIVLVVASLLASIIFFIKVEIWESALCSTIYIKHINEKKLKQDLFYIQ